MLIRIVDYLKKKIRDHNEKRFDDNFKYAQDIVDVERILRNLERHSKGGLI